MIERTFVEQGIKRVELEEYLAKELEKAGFTKSEIVKTPLVTRIIVNVIKPGLAIGKSGSNIRKLTETIATKYDIENPQLEIKEIPVPELDATAMVNKIKALIERGFSWRSVAYRTVKDIEAKGAQGIELTLSGKLAGKGGRKRKQRIAIGYMKKVEDKVKLVDFSKAAAYPKPGAIGIKLRIVKPETVFPDKVNILELLNTRREIAKEEAEKKEKEENKKDEEKEDKTKETKEKKEETTEKKEKEENKKEAKVKEGKKENKTKETKEKKEESKDKLVEEKKENKKEKESTKTIKGDKKWQKKQQKLEINQLQNWRVI